MAKTFKTFKTVGELKQLAQIALQKHKKSFVMRCQCIKCLLLLFFLM